MDNCYSQIDYHEQRALINQKINKINLNSVSTYFHQKLSINILSLSKLSTNGVINFLYILQTNDKKLLLRIANPHPFWKNVKTQNEVTILKLVKQNTQVPVPTIIDYQIDQQKCSLGCQYILFQYIENDGTLEDYLEQIKDHPDFLLKAKQILKQGIEFVAQIASIKLNNDYIGGVSIDKQPIGIRWDGPNIGPFKTVHELLSQGLRISLLHLQKVQNIQDIIKGLRIVKSEIQTKQFEKFIVSKQFVWKHNDLHMGNISVKDGKINGIYDWQAARTGLLQQHQCQYNLSQWFDDYLNQQSKNQLFQYQQHLLQQLHILIQPSHSSYKKYFQIMHYSFWSWFYSVSWWNDQPDQSLPLCVKTESQTNLTKLRTILTNQKYI